ncbi:MAG TPA: hypothetical protein VKB48_17440 [Candidatus Acidoferrum sp.]|nr:hypothetical protein [Candidatus Acidoferrum sp.]
MRRMAAGPVLWALALGAGAARAEVYSCPDLRAQKEKVYGFHLTQLNESQIDAKSKEIDAYWKRLQSAGPEGVSCLKEMLAGEKTDHLFQFDAASFLFQLDKSPDSLNLVRDAIVQTDFQETDPANYLSLAMDLGQRGVDIRPLAAKILLFPNAVIHISEHSLDLDSDTAALFLYGSMDSTKATKALITQLQAQEPFVRAAAAHLLAEQMTEEAFRGLNKWSGLADVTEDYRVNDIQSVMKYQATDPAELANAKWTREQVLQIIAGLPHTRQEFDDVMSTKGAEFDRQMREKKLSQDELAKAVAESAPIYGIADHTAFQNSAVATLKAEDFETIRQARRKALFNVSDEGLSEYLAYTQIMIRMLNHLDLYKDYRAH